MGLLCLFECFFSSPLLSVDTSETYYLLAPSRRQPPFNPYFWQNRNLSSDIQDIQLSELSNMQNPFNSLRREFRVSQNYGVVPDAVFVPCNSYYDSFGRQFQNELELKHHFNSLLNVYERKELNTDWRGRADSSEQWYAEGDDGWSPAQHTTHQQLQHINDGSWVTFNNV